MVYRQGDARFDPYGVDRFLKPMADDLTADVSCQQSAPLAQAVCDDVLLVPDPNLTDYFLEPPACAPALVWAGAPTGG